MATKTETRRVTIYLNGKAVEGTIKDMRKEWNKLNNDVSSNTQTQEEYQRKTARMRELDGMIKAHRNNIKDVGTAWDKSTSGLNKFIGLAAAKFTFDAVVDFGKEIFNASTQLEVLEQKAATVFGEALPQVTAAAEENANAMGLTSQEYVNAATAIGDLLIPMGFQREEAANISTGLVDLSGALSEWTGGQKSAEEVSKTLAKAMLGEREELKGLGISIQEADVQARLAEKGLKGLTGEMLQQAKAAATLELITEKSVDAQTAFANNSDTLVRKQAELSAKFADIKESLDSALIPVFHRLLEVVEPVVTTVADFVIALLRGEVATGKLSGGAQVLATILTNIGQVVGFVFSGFQKLGAFLLNNFGGVIETIGTRWINFYNGMVYGFNELNRLVGLDYKMKPIDIEAFKKSLQEAKQSLNDAGLDQNAAPSASGNTGPSAEERAQAQARADQAKAAAEKLAKQQEKEADREAKALETKYQKLNEIIKKYEEQNRLDALSENERKIAELEASYQVEIDKAKELEEKKQAGATEQRKILEQLKSDAVNDLKEQLAQEEFDKAMKLEEELMDAETEAMIANMERKRELEAEIRETLQTDQDRELEEVELFYFDLLNQAEQFGIDTAALEEKRQAEIDAIKKKYRDKDTADTEKANLARLRSQQQMFKSLSDLIGASLAAWSEDEKDALEFQKAATIFQIGLDTASAISSMVAAASKSAGNPIVLAIEIASGLAIILSNIAKAKQLLNENPEPALPQRKEGGWLNVRGADDGQVYSAKYIGSPLSGMLPGHPVVLASEAGPEYFVSNRDLSNPKVLNHVRAIDNIVTARRFEDGGSTAPLANTSGNATVGNTTIAFPPEMIQLMRLNVQLLTTLNERGVIAMLPDDTVVGIIDKYNELNEASGGVLGL